MLANLHLSIDGKMFLSTVSMIEDTSLRFVLVKQAALLENCYFAEQKRLGLSQIDFHFKLRTDAQLKVFLFV